MLQKLYEIKQNTGCFFRKFPPRKVLSMELVPLNRIKSPSTLVPSKATRGAKNNQNRRFLTLQWCSAVVFKHYTIFSLFIRLQTCDTGHSKLPSLKNSTSHSNAGLSLVFHLPHSSWMKQDNSVINISINEENKEKWLGNYLWAYSAVICARSAPCSFRSTRNVRCLTVHTLTIVIKWV